MNLYKAGKKAQMIVFAILAKKLLKTIAALVVFQAILLEFFWSKRFTKRSLTSGLISVDLFARRAGKQQRIQHSNRVSQFYSQNIPIF